MMDQDNNLSERELEILKLVATGASNKEIAQRLVISPNTVKVHLRNIFSKIGINSRTEAVLFALRIRLIEHPSNVPENEAVEDAIIAETGEEKEISSSTPHAEILNVLPVTHKNRRVLLVFGLIILFLVLAAGGLWISGGLMLQPAAPTISNLPAQNGTPIVPTANDRWQVLAPLAEGRNEMAGAVYEGSIYLIAGESASGPTGNVQRYNPRSDQWEKRAPKPLPVSGIQAALIGERIYVPGGRGPGGINTSALEIYDPRLDRWEKGAPMPAALSNYALAALEGRLYVFGGLENGMPSAHVFVYDPLDDTWTERSQLPIACARSAAASLQGKIYLFGGWDGKNDLAAVRVYLPSRDRPGEHPWEDRNPLPLPRAGLAAAALADQIYLAGGSESNEPIEYLPQSGQWLNFETSPEAVGSGLLLLPLDNRLHFIGGRLPTGLLSAHQAYQAIYTILVPLVQ